MPHISERLKTQERVRIFAEKRYWRRQEGVGCRDGLRVTLVRTLLPASLEGRKLGRTGGVLSQVSPGTERNVPGELVLWEV